MSPRLLEFLLAVHLAIVEEIHDLQELPIRVSERAIIELSSGIDGSELTLEEIGDKFGLTRERVRQIREKSIRKLRAANKNSLLRGYLG